MARKKTRFPHRSSSDEGLGGVAAVGAGRDDTKHCQDSTRRELLRSVPAAEAVGVILHQEGQVIDTLPNHLAIRKQTHKSFFERFPYSMFVPSMSWQNDQFQHEKWRKSMRFLT